MQNYDVDVMNLQRVAEASVPGALVEVSWGTAPPAARPVILATGARWREMNVPGEKEYRTRGRGLLSALRRPRCSRAKRVAVIGGGNSGVEAAIDLAGVVAHVTCWSSPTPARRCGAAEALRSPPNVTVIKSAQTTEVTGADKVNGLRLKDRRPTPSTGRTEGHLRADRPAAQHRLPQGVELSRFGEVIVDAKGQTSVPGIFAAGDCTTVPYKQIIIAMGEGAKARCPPSTT